MVHPDYMYFPQLSGALGYHLPFHLVLVQFFWIYGVVAMQHV